MKKAKFTIGPFQAFQQAWTAMLKGHFVRRRGWPANICYMLDDSQALFGDVHFAMVTMDGDRYTATANCDNLTALDIVCSDWEILKQAWK